MRVRIGYPDRNSELEMLAANVGAVDGRGTSDEMVINPDQLSSSPAVIGLTPERTSRAGGGI